MLILIQEGLKIMWGKMKILVTSLFSSPEHVLRVSYCDQSMSVVRPFKDLNSVKNSGCHGNRKKKL